MRKDRRRKGVCVHFSSNNDGDLTEAIKLVMYSSRKLSGFCSGFVIIRVRCMVLFSSSLLLRMLLLVKQHFYLVAIPVCTRGRLLLWPLLHLMIISANFASAIDKE